MLLLCGAVGKGKVNMLMVLFEGVIGLPAKVIAAVGEFVSACSTGRFQNLTAALLASYHRLFTCWHSRSKV